MDRLPETDNAKILDEHRMLLDELGVIGAKRPAAKSLRENLEHGGGLEGPYTIGLALSGGGIRSATVSLGIMQKLAGAGLLKHVDYLSTVSGGGYIGSALTWWLRGNAADEPPYESVYDTEKHFPFGIDDPELPEPGVARAGDRSLTPLQYLRVQGNYLAPGNGLSIWSGIAVVARAIFLNLMIWIPVTAFVMLLIYGAGRLPFLKGLPFAVRMVAPGSLETAADAVGSSGAVELNQTIPPAFLLMLVLAAVLFVLFLLASINHSLLSWTDLTESGARQQSAEANPVAEKQKWYSWLLVGLVSVAGFALLAVTVLWMKPAIYPLFSDYRYWMQPASPPSWFEGPATGFFLWFVALAATALCFTLMGETRVRGNLGGKNQKAVAATLIGLLAVVALSFLAEHFFAGSGRTLAKRLPAFLKFIYGIAFLAYANYIIGLLIRHILRAQAVGSPSAEARNPTAALLQYRARRVFEWFFGRTLFASIILVIVGTLPLVSSYINYRLGGVWTALGLAITLGGHLWSRVRGHSKLTAITIMLGAALFAYGVLLVGHRLALTFMDGDAVQRALAVAAMIIAVIAGWFVNTNHIGLHRFYRDRLMEAFLPDAEGLRKDTNAVATGANERRLADSWNSAWSKGPYHIINTNVVLANSAQRKHRLRGGDSFVLTPRHIGSSATGWHNLGDTASSDMTLSSAMAISGAAANPRGAAGGRGLMRSSSIALAMSLLNVRLGYWIPNPLHGQPSILPTRPNHFWPGGLYAVTRGGYVETAKWLELADGGHFENLAIYELVRRRCGLIIVCDGGQDNASSYADLVTAVQRVSQDFGATVQFNMEVKETADGEFKPSSPAQMIADPKNLDYPKGAEFAAKGYFVGSIDYGERGGNGWPRRGTLIYLKSALIRSLAIRAKGYRGAHHDFPNESTGDQFFDDEQFEAYREVGFRICEQMIKDLDLAKLFEESPPPIAKLRDAPRFRVAGND
jgi:Patatin-like phospholipase